jgi:methylated-DNA-protein-cysteine methyltransferase-like protein
MTPPRDLGGLILKVVAAIPRGRVATYGQVAALAGAPGRARQVGRCLFQLPDGARVPWHRVVNAAGKVSYHPARRGADDFQRVLLEAEGVAFDQDGRIDLLQHGWKGPRR